jgi:hypothetical protein
MPRALDGQAPSTAAPPSASGTPSAEPRTDKPTGPSPGVRESRYYDPYPVASTDTAAPPRERCTVIFWNVSDRDLLLRVNDQSQVLPRGRSLRIESCRAFTWQVEGREAQSEKVADSESAIEIVIRR